MPISSEYAQKLSELMGQLNTSAQRENTTEIVSIVAFLIGVRKQIFENPHEPPQLDVYERLQQDKRARIIRNLCAIRSSMFIISTSTNSISICRTGVNRRFVYNWNPSMARG